jgi:hypothetical protein
MTRSSRTPRRLIVGGETYLWSVRHEHHGEEGHYEDCREVLTIRRPGALGRLELVFGRDEGRGHDLAHLATPLDLEAPATVLALLTEAARHGSPVSADAAEQQDGWPLFDEAMGMT